MKIFNDKHQTWNSCDLVISVLLFFTNQQKTFLLWRTVCVPMSKADFIPDRRKCATLKGFISDGNIEEVIDQTKSKQKYCHCACISGIWDYTQTVPWTLTIFALLSCIFPLPRADRVPQPALHSSLPSQIGSHYRSAHPITDGHLTHRWQTAKEPG